MPGLTAALNDELSALLGPEGWRTDEPARRAHGEDDSRQWAMPDAVAIPADAAEVAAVVRACRAHRVAVVARGAGTGTTAGAVPFTGGVVVSFRSEERRVGKGRRTRWGPCRAGCEERG